MKLILQAIMIGIGFFCCWVGLGMIQIMAESERVIIGAYRAGAVLSVMVALLAIPLLYWFQKRNGRLLSLEDFLPPI